MILYTTGDGSFKETEWSRLERSDDEIAVKSILTGVCRSDIDMMNGDFTLPDPIGMSGHEGLGQVIEIGKNVRNVKLGDYVATRGEPAYADEYNVRYGEFVVVPSADPKYILEPVACGVNVVLQAKEMIYKKAGGRCAILGSGFLAWVAYNTIKTLGLPLEVEVQGRSNKDMWGDVLQERLTGKFDVVIDLVGRDFVDINDEALIIKGVPTASTKEFEEVLLWKACTTIRPSPRTKHFYDAMVLAKGLVESDSINVDKFWTKGYDRETEWTQAFEDGLNRPENYSRGYIKWR